MVYFVLKINNKEEKKITIKLNLDTWGGRRLKKLIGERGQVQQYWGSEVNVVGSRVWNVHGSGIDLCRICDRDQNAADVKQSWKCGDVVVASDSSIFTVITSPTRLHATLVGRVVEGLDSLQHVVERYGRSGTNSPVYISSCGQV